jgi:hypothetical protein
MLLFHRGVSLRFSIRNFPDTSELLLDDACSCTIAIIWSLWLKYSFFSQFTIQSDSF